MHSSGTTVFEPNTPRMIAWEVTRRCNLNCIHCRASADNKIPEGELSTREALDFLDHLAGWAKPVIILTGGEPLLREDVFELAAQGTALGLRMVMAPNGTLVTAEAAKRMKDSGIKRVSISLDGAARETHDQFRQVDGAFQGALRGIEELRRAGVEFQVNTTITRKNLSEIPALLDFSVHLGAAAHHFFLLVPTGRGKDLVDQSIDAVEYEKVLNWLYDQREKAPIHIKATCAPHYYRIMRQRARQEGKKISYESHGLDAVTRGCLGGISFCFISHVGQVQPCGYLELSAGNLRQTPFREIWERSELFLKLRNFDDYKGKCGVCEYRKVCGGCRARAYEATGDVLAEEPLCTYMPAGIG